MRPAWFALSLSALAACTGPNTTTVPLDVNWMEWPAEVLAGQAFGVRLVVPEPFCATVLALGAPATVDVSAVTFEPFALVRDDPGRICAQSPSASAPVSPFPFGPARDTTVQVAGLAASYPRTYQLRATAIVDVTVAAASALPERTFGTVTVLQVTAAATRTNAGGFAWIVPGRTQLHAAHAAGPVLDSGLCGGESRHGPRGNRVRPGLSVPAGRAAVRRHPRVSSAQRQLSTVGSW